MKDSKAFKMLVNNIVKSFEYEYDDAEKYAKYLLDLQVNFYKSHSDTH